MQLCRAGRILQVLDISDVTDSAGCLANLLKGSGQKNKTHTTLKVKQNPGTQPPFDPALLSGPW